MGACFTTWNGVVSNSTPWAPLAGVAPSGTANTTKTMLQVGGWTKKWRIIEWGYIFTTAPTGTDSYDPSSPGVEGD